jgi:hypothetical protein
VARKAGTIGGRTLNPHGVRGLDRAVHGTIAAARLRITENCIGNTPRPLTELTAELLDGSGFQFLRTG